MIYIYMRERESHIVLRDTTMLKSTIRTKMSVTCSNTLETHQFLNTEIMRILLKLVSFRSQNVLLAFYVHV